MLTGRHDTVTQRLDGHPDFTCGAVVTLFGYFEPGQVVIVYCFNL